MASIYAIQTTCEAVIRLLKASYHPDLMQPSIPLDFEVYSTENFRNHMTAGVSLFLYRVYANQTQRTPMGRTENGKTFRTQLPLDLHFFLTIWARSASLQHAILGWAMRTLEDYPILPASLLNNAGPGVFAEHETVEIVLGQLNNEEMMRIWDDLSTDYQLTIPYIARIVRIDSSLTDVAPRLVRQRDLEYAAPNE